MEKRIRTLYIITIIAILAFLGMQVYWLYGRYEYSLTDYERNLASEIIECVARYNEIRNKTSVYERTEDGDSVTYPTFSLYQHYGDTVRTERTAKIYTVRYSAYDLLGIEPGTTLTQEQKNKAVDLAAELSIAPSDSMIYDASSARDENEAWAAAKDVQTQKKHPFTVAGVDSVLRKAGIKAEISLAKADTMVWRTRTCYHNSVFSPEISVSVPYVQFEGMTVEIRSGIDIFDVLPNMMRTFVMVVLVSGLLIVCLMLQFSTVLKLSRIDRLRASFVSTIIHELKRPISTLKMCVSGIENEKMMADDATRRELIAETRGALDNLSAYFSKLRDITFNNVEQIPLNIVPLRLHPLFDAVAAATVIPPGKEVVIVNDIDPLLEISADRSHLFNILNNLVENAVKYSGTSVRIKAESFISADSVGIRISDDGNGISAADLRYVFNRFYRGKAAATDVPGIGLGLAYVRLLVEAHGGVVEVDSTEGKGTSFTITMPQ